MDTKIPSLLRYWGKADRNYPGEPKWHPLVCHCLDVAAVGWEFLDRFAPARQLIAAELGTHDEAAVIRWSVFWLALHDLGKFSEAFQSQHPDLFHELRGRNPSPARPYRVRHDTLGMLFWRDVLESASRTDTWFGSDSGELSDGLAYWFRAVTGHHGQPPNEDLDHWTQHFDRREDRDAVFAFVSDLRVLLLDANAAAVPSTLDGESFRRASAVLSWWIAGIAVLADWLGSNTRYFPYCTPDLVGRRLADYWQRARQQAGTALDAAGLLANSSASAQTLADLFPRITRPSPLQDWAATVPIQAAPQIHLLEDVTGSGKTEAAILLTHRLMDSGCANGFFIGLPTMATANAMYGRIAQVYEQLFSGSASLVLAHGQRNLVEAFANSVLPGDAPEIDPRQADDTASARCTAWLADHNKRALLAPAGIGTIDQALLAVLHSRHQSLRLLGLFRKVLVVDEVHACDAYMQSVLESLLEFHARAGGSAILLSATLPIQMKESLLKAFARGRLSDAPVVGSGDYPLATSWCSSIPETLNESAIAPRPDACRTIAVRYESEPAEIIAAINEAIGAGKCVCWMRNTIADALAAYALFAPTIPPDRLTLFHARFALRDRLAIESEILRRFGPDSTNTQRAGRLVIATQVVEQSLDVDWDMVVTDLAPIDRIIQRGGRLHRHPRDSEGRRIDGNNRGDARGKPCLWVHGPNWTIEPKADWFKSVFPKAAMVYPDHGQLWNTAKELQTGRITMPDDARRLLEAVFGEDATIPAELEPNANAALGAMFADIGIAQQNILNLEGGYLRGGIDWWSEAKTPSRLGDASMNVLLARWEGETLRPWVEGASGWAYSSVRVAARLIARSVEPADAARKAAFEQTVNALPNKGKWSVILPLEDRGDGWVATAWTEERQKRPARMLTWRYDSIMGLRQSVPAPEDDE
jgi:CRISPR-associated endonuclease/helicase Cas3